MAKLDELFKSQIDKAEARFEERKKTVRRRKKYMGNKGDWRKVEDPDRVLGRMISLGMKDIASELLAKEVPTEAVASIIRPDERISLLERIIEENDLISSRFLHLGSIVARAVGRILIRNRGRTVGYGTGFFISPQLLMTNNHVLSNTAMAGRCAVEFDYYERSDGATGPTLIFDFDPGRFFLTDKDLDFTIVAVLGTSHTGAPHRERGWIPLIPDSGKVLIGEPVNLIQHPGGGPQQIAIKNNEVFDVVGNFLHYKADTQKGSSGACVLNMQWDLAALHHAGVPKRDPQKRILLRDRSVWDGRRNTADRIDWIANEGVRISSIVSAVREALSDDQGTEQELFEESLIAPALPQSFKPASSIETTPAMIVPRVPGVGETTVELDDETLDRLTPEEVAQIVTELEDQSFDITLEAAAPGEVIVAEGDSWFDYSLAGLDIIDCLKKFHKYKIHNVAKGGDTIDNMAWGTSYSNRRWTRDPSPLEETLKAVRKYKPRVVLLSAGGNDVAGVEFDSYLNHKKSGEDPVREDFVNYIFKIYFRGAFEYIFDQVWDIDDTIHIVMHGYGYAQPDGRGVIRFFGRNLWIGPWLRPALTAKGYTEQKERERIVGVMIDRFNDMLRDLARDDDKGRIHYINLRPIIRRVDWENELHLKNSAFRRVAAEFDRVIQQIV